MHKKRGQGLPEYALVLALISLAVIVAMKGLGDDAISQKLYGNINTNLSEAQMKANTP